MKHLFCETRRVVGTTWDDRVDDKCPICNGLHPTIEIDELVYPIVDTFNRLGYHTDFSCSSHIVCGDMLKPRIDGEFYICFEPVFIEDLIKYDQDMNFTLLVDQFRGKIRMFELYDVEPNIELEYRTDFPNNLTIRNMVYMFSRINTCTTVPEIPFDTVNGHDLYYEWTWVVEHCFYKTKEHCGYRPHISLRCITKDNDTHTFTLNRSYYKYMSDLCAIMDLFNRFIETKIHYRAFPESRYKPELRNLEDGYYIALISDFEDIKSCAEKDVEIN